MILQEQKLMPPDGLKAKEKYLGSMSKGEIIDLK